MYTSVRSDGTKEEFPDLHQAQCYLLGITPTQKFDEFTYPAPGGRVYLSEGKIALIGCGADGGLVGFVSCYACGSKKQRKMWGGWNWKKYRCVDCGHEEEVAGQGKYA
jgi:hypothetical protein